MINRDDPRHQHQRKLLSGRFSPRAVRRHEQRVRAIAADLIAAAAAKGTAEVVSDIAAPLPSMVIAELLGFDRALWPKCMEWSERTMGAAGFRDDDPRQPAADVLGHVQQRRLAAATTRATTWSRPGCTGRWMASRWMSRRSSRRAYCCSTAGPRPPGR